MPIKNNPILIDDELQAAKQREIVKQGIGKRGYDHSTHIVNPKSDGVYFSRTIKSNGEIKNRIDMKEA
jgi:hypothetical protein